MAHWKRRGVRSTVVAALLLVLLTSVAGAAEVPPPGHPGVWSLIDTPTYPGATCVFHDFNPRDDLYRIKARSPVVYAFDRTGATDSQWVGWRFKVQYTDDNVSDGPRWHTASTSTWVKATATDHYNAQWPEVARGADISVSTAHAAWRVVVLMRWYYPNGATPDGTVTALPVNYVERYGGQDQGSSFGPWCGTTLG